MQDVGRLSKEIGSVGIPDGKLEQKEIEKLEAQAVEVQVALEGVGQTMKIASLGRASTVEKMGKETAVEFPYQNTENEDYEKAFLAELQRQLTHQEEAINALTIDEWAARVAAFGLKEKDFKIIDEVASDKARQAAAKILDERVKLGKEYLQIQARKKAKKKGENPTAAQPTAAQQERQGRSEADANLRMGHLTSGHNTDATGEDKRARDNVTGRMAFEDMQRASAPKENAEGLADLKGQENAAGGDWAKLLEDGEKLALLHTPDMIAGGHGIMMSVEHLTQPSKDDVEAWKDYLAQLKKYFGPTVVNSRIGTLWKNKIQDAYSSVARDPNYPEAAFPLWKVNLKLSAKKG